MDEKKQQLSIKYVLLLILLLVGILVLGGLVFTLISLPVLFDFTTAPVVGKVFMILGSILVLLGIVAYCIVLKAREKNSWKAICFVMLFIAYYAYVLLAYFDFEIWGSKKYFWTLLLGGIILCVGYNVASDFQSIFNKEKIVMIIVSIAFLLASFFVLNIPNDAGANDVLLKIAVGILYVVAIPCFIKTTLFSSKKRDKEHFIFPLMMSILIGAGIIISLPYFIYWCGLRDDHFRTFVSVYSALVGGGLTLAGVAWTIYKSEKNKQEEDRKKAKPLFTANRMLSDKVDTSKEKLCFDFCGSAELGEYPCSVTMRIENSNQNSFKLLKIFHDNKWWDITADNVVLPSKEVVFHFWFKEDVNCLYLQVQDGLGNIYYYEIKVLLLSLLLGNKAQNPMAHTVREIKEVSREEVAEGIQESKKEVTAIKKDQKDDA